MKLFASVAIAFALLTLYLTSVTAVELVLPTDQFLANEDDLYQELLSQLDGDLLTQPSLSEMQISAYLSGASYCIGQNIQAVADWKCAMCKQSGLTLGPITAWEFSGYQLGAYVAVDTKHETIWVVYRGSSNFANWMANLNTGKVAFSLGGEVHGGFLIAYQQTRPSIIAKLKEYGTKYPRFPVKVTGHSLGGAVAVIAYLDLKASNFLVTDLGPGLTPHVSSTLLPESLPMEHSQLELLGGGNKESFSVTVHNTLITFGQPRVGNAAFVNVLNAKSGGSYWRVTHRNDPVPRIPIQAMGFIHGPREIYFPEKDSNTSFRLCTAGNIEDPSCIISGLINVAISDHSWGAGIYLSQTAASCKP